jgi:hypothetical protein
LGYTPPYTPTVIFLGYDSLYARAVLTAHAGIASLSAANASSEDWAALPTANAMASETCSVVRSLIAKNRYFSRGKNLCSTGVLFVAPKDGSPCQARTD